MTTNEQDELDRIFNDLEHGMPYSISGWDDAWPQAKAALQAYIAHHTKEAVLKARIDENRLARNAMEPNTALGVPYVPSFDLYTSNRNHELELELAAPQQSTSPDGSAE